MIFREKQKYNQIGLWLLLLVLLVWFIYNLITAETASLSLVIPVVTIFVLILLFASLALKTVISDQGITISFGVFSRKYIEWLEVAEIEVIDYGFIGGWGIRLSSKYGIVYNVKGRKGILISDHDGKKIVIGTQKEDEAEKVIQKLFYV